MFLGNILRTVSTFATYTFCASRRGKSGYLTMVLVKREIFFAWFVNKRKKKILARFIVIRKEN